MENNRNSGSRIDVLKLLRKSVYKQAILAVMLILLTVVLLFAITTAWYTNVVQTSGLMFEAASWGFEGSIAVADDPVEAGPGDDGGVYLTLQNESESLVDVSVYVDKTNMGTDMKKRLFFYVETSAMRSGELVDRVYLSKSNGYDYTVIGLGNLSLTETYHNDAPIQWEWVYDMLGYYVTGTQNADGTVSVQEYLRPVEYTYDENLTTFSEPDEKGVRRLETIDGFTTMAEFLQQVTSADGYSGVLAPDMETGEIPRTADGYYPISVDEDTGSGVWLYLCSYSEIEQGIIWDTQQGQLADSAREPFTAILNITAQKSDVETTVITSQTELYNALTAETGSQSGSVDQVLQLSGDLSLNHAALPAGKKVLLDLNGHTLTATNDNVAMVEAGEGSSMTVLNGTITGSGTGAEGNVAFAATGAEITLSNVTATGVGRLVNFMDSSGTGVDSKVRLLGCTVSAEDCAVYVVGNGLQSENPTQLVIENSTISGNYAGILCNGSTGGNGNWGTDITIIKSSVSGYWTGIYHPQQDSTLTILDSSVEGYTGLALKGGQARIVTSQIRGTGKGSQPSYDNSGWSDTGDGIYVECNYGWPISLEITGSTVTSDYAFAVRKFEETAEHATITIYSGTFDSDVSAFVASGSQMAPDGYNYVVSVGAAEETETETAE